MYGCASGTQPIGSNRLEMIKATGELDPDTGVIVLSLGRDKKACDKCKTNIIGILPFVSYRVVSEGEEMKELAFLPAEAGAINQLGKKHYGYIHMRELPVGEYYLLGVGSRGRGAALAAGGSFVYIGSGENETPITYKFEVLANKINYLGSLITNDGRLDSSSISIFQTPDRDLEYAIKKYPELKKYEVIHTSLN